MSFHAYLTLAFFLAFVVLILWVFRPGRKEQYQKLGDIPLDSDKETTTYRQGEQHG
ncbi:MAG TPA: cbb3-type cytochrome c oxidase subunit 3 [Alcanivoracaceae bacterium]|nr:cbb3-type cytochrome c oxidase subunit 3 [Alcanivoracaceae bacterium]